MRRQLSISLTLLTLLLPLQSFASRPVSEAEYRNYIPILREKALAAGISKQTVDTALHHPEFISRAISLDKKQPYKTLTFKEYLQRVVPQSRINQARKKYQQNSRLLHNIGKQYGVQPRFIVALWAIESNFGENMGGFNIIDSLATLAYEGRREEFFTKELINALKIIDQGNIEAKNMKGSWAGAMGQTQFMPSSYLELAADGNNDGKKDIWNTRADVFASIANYLSKRGWDDKFTWGRKVKLPSNFNSALIGKGTEKTLEEWSSLGVRKANNAPLPKEATLVASLIQPESGKNETYIVYSNYKTILKWNRSTYFATAVGILADAIVR